MATDRTGIIRRDRVATHARLLAAARREFAEHGYDGTSVRRIADAAGVDAALIFRYFGSKAGLFVAATAGEDPARLLGVPPAEFANRLLSVLAFPTSTRRPWRRTRGPSWTLSCEPPHHVSEGRALESGPPKT